MSKQIFRLVHAEARHRAAQAVQDAPDGHVITISEPTRNLSQNALMWALLSDVAEQVDWHGNKLTPDEWKDVFSAAIHKQKVVPGIDGGFVVCGQRTSKMSKAEFSEMVELIQAFAAQQDVRIAA